MRRIGVCDEPSLLDRPPHRGIAGLVIQAEPLGNFVHRHPVARPTAANPHDVLSHGLGSAVGIWCSVTHGP
jgi:hypothetical protein